MDQEFYITTAIDYPIGDPHVGGAFEKIGADVQTRYQRMQGQTTRLLLGSDEHPGRVLLRAKDGGFSLQTYVDQRAQQLQMVWRTLEVEHDHYFRTSSSRHQLGCRHYIEELHRAGLFYKRSHESLYCTGCEEFKRPDDLVAGKCEEHESQYLQPVQSSYFFALSRFKKRLLNLYAERAELIYPKSAQDRVRAWLEMGLEDIPVTRGNVPWGVRVPFDENETIWIWFEALLSYITAVGYGTDAQQLERCWPARIQIVGRDILWYHAVLWPAMLMAIGLEPPKRLQVHGLLTWNGEKLSKTLGNGVSPTQLTDQFGIDALRYYLMRVCPFDQDSDFSLSDFRDRCSRDLTDKLELLYLRTVALCLQHPENDIVEPHSLSAYEVFGTIDLANVIAAIRTGIEEFQYQKVLDTIWKKLLDPAIKYLDSTVEPAISKRRLIEMLRVLAILLKPFMPGTSELLYGTFDHMQGFAGVRLEDCLIPGNENVQLRFTQPVANIRPAVLSRGSETHPDHGFER